VGISFRLLPQQCVLAKENKHAYFIISINLSVSLQTLIIAVLNENGYIHPFI
jgi:hypothetical protein